MRWDLRTRHEAVDLFELGYGYKAVAARLGCPRGTVRKWLYAFRIEGKDIRLVESHRTYSQELKIAAVLDFLDHGMSKPEIMEKHGIRSLNPLVRWIRLYREGGPDALAPRARGRRRRQDPPVFLTREDELLARIQELELELAIQKRINALADGIGRERHGR